MPANIMSALPFTANSFTCYASDKLPSVTHVDLAKFRFSYELTLAARKSKPTVNDSRAKEPLRDKDPPDCDYAPSYNALKSFGCKGRLS